MAKLTTKEFIAKAKAVSGSPGRFFDPLKMADG